MNHDVFICHARKDKSIADAISEKLESAGLKCWITPRDVSPRDDWTEATRKAIAASRVIVVVLSENADAASHIERELAHAFYARRMIIPFRLGEILSRREIVFYLGDVPWCNSSDPPTEEDLETLTARVKDQMPVSGGGAGNSDPHQGERKKAASLSTSDSWYDALLASHYQPLGILKWVAITTFLCAIMLFLWFVLHQTTEWASLAESHRRTTDRGLSLSPTPLPQVPRDSLASKQTPAYTRFGLWQADGSPSPLVQETQDQPANSPSAQSANVSSSPQRYVTPSERTGELASESRPRHSPPVSHRVLPDHRQQFPGTQVKEARRIADLENQRSSLRSQLKETEANATTIQKNADLVSSQRDQLQALLKASEEKEQIAQKTAELEAGELDVLRAQLKEAENKALTAEKNEELVRTQRDALQVRLRETQREAQAAMTKAELVTRQRDTLQSEVSELKTRVQRAETDANLAASQRDTMEAELTTKEQEAAQEKKLSVNQPDVDLAASSESAPDTQFPEDRRQPVHEDAELAQTQPPNPGQNAKPAPLTQTLDPFVRPTQ
jgi:TIR domain